MKYCDKCHSAYPDDFTICPRDQGALRHASDLVPGMIIRSKYEILEKIGAGGMAAVYRARHLAFGEIVAIKLVGPKLAHDTDFLKRFRTEAVVTRKLQHPNAVRVEDLDTTEDGRPFIVMEFVEGRSLRELIRAEGALPLPRAVTIARQACAALAAAHAIGITHRDIKPDNILLARAPDGRDLVKVLDFGIAKVKEGAIDTGEGYTPTQTGMVMGTPQYISPEQAMGKRGAEVDGRSDLYSLGVVLYEMVTGRLPFSSDTAMGMILHHLQTTPTPPQLARADLSIPAPLSDLLMKALQKERERRFGSASEMLAALDEVAVLPLPSRPLPEAPRHASRESPVPAPTPEPAEIPTPRPAALTRVDDIEDRPTRAMPYGGRATPVPPLPSAFPPLPRGEPTPIPSPTMHQSAWWLVLLLLPFRIAFFPFLLLRRVARRLTRGAASSGPPATVVGPRRRAFPGWLFGRWWFWVAFGMFMLIFRSGRDERHRDRPEADTKTTAEAPQDAAAGHASDQAIQTKVQQALSASQLTRQEEIEVEADEGTVTLRGTVGAPLVSQLAEALAAAVPGVKKVDNRLEVARGQPGLDGPVWPDLRGVPFLDPPEPGSPQATALAELLENGQRALKENRPEEALGMFGAALSLDPRNRVARRGLEQATRQMKRNRLAVPPHAGAPPTPPS